MKIQDLRKKSQKDLEKLAVSIREDIAKASVDVKSSKDNNVRAARNNRKDLSRVLTLINEKTNESAAAETKKEDK